MERTTEGATAEAAAGARGDEAERAARAKARIYLDLWEQQVVQTALYGPVASWRPPSS